MTGPETIVVSFYSILSLGRLTERIVYSINSIFKLLNVKPLHIENHFVSASYLTKSHCSAAGHIPNKEPYKRGQNKDIGIGGHCGKK